MTIVSTTIAKTDEWQMVQRTVGVGDSILPLYRRNGVIMDVPSDPNLAEKFKISYPFAAFTDPDAKKVFVYRQVQIGISGRIKQGQRPAESIAASVCTSYPVESGMESVRDVPPMLFPDGGVFVCCIPTESRLMWNRADANMVEGAVCITVDRKVDRHRLLLAKGSIEVNGVLYDKPSIISIKRGDVLAAKSKVFAAEVWV